MTGDWPVVPPVPMPVRPPALLIAEPPIINPDVRLIATTIPPRTRRIVPSRAAQLVWQPRFAYAAAAVILLALTIVSLPLWIVLYRLLGTSGVPVGDLMALCMMLLGGFLAATAAWVIIVEMRGRVRMVDTLARTGDREMTVATVMRPFGQLWAQIALLAVALTLFVGAIILSV